MAAHGGAGGRRHPQVDAVPAGGPGAARRVRGGGQRAGISTRSQKYSISVPNSPEFLWLCSYIGAFGKNRQIFFYFAPIFVIKPGP